MVEGHEGSTGDDLTDNLYSADEGDSESDSDTEQAREELWNDVWANHLFSGGQGVSPMDDDALIQYCFGPREEEEEENAGVDPEIEDLESWVEDWFEESLEEIEDFDVPVTYNLHLDGARRWCTGGDDCTHWHESMLL